MEQDKSEDKFIIEGNPGQGNTFVKIGHVENYNPNATTVTTTITNNNYYGKQEDDGHCAKSGEKKLIGMTLRDMLRNDLIDTTGFKKKITDYVGRIQPLLKEDKRELFMQLWPCIFEHEMFKVEIFDPGKQNCPFNRNLIGNILRHLDSKGFYKDPYNSSAMARLLENSDDNPVRLALRKDLDEKYKAAVDAIIQKL